MWSSWSHLAAFRCTSCLFVRQLSTRTSFGLKKLQQRNQVANENSLVRRFLSSAAKKPPQHPFYDAEQRRKRAIAAYVVAAAAGMFGLAYAGVPLYRIYCQATGKGTKAELTQSSAERVLSQKKITDRVLSVRFNADVSSEMTWNFRPLQREIKVIPGETALAFYTARNPESRPIIGIATYNIVPYEAAQYFTKIQCFCFDEQRLNPNEDVEMPVLFYIDSDFANDPKMEKIDTITLSYTFFESKADEGELQLSPLIAR